MVEYDAQNECESMQETGETFKESGELKTISDIVKVNLWKTSVIQLITFQ